MAPHADASLAERLVMRWHRAVAPHQPHPVSGVQLPQLFPAAQGSAAGTSAGHASGAAHAHGS
ncbi:MAG: hypothetical protein JWM10_1119 [Myxococcaceae bacterium]|nr:hypothetical protein [Myxococcaceae bacterium]